MKLILVLLLLIVVVCLNVQANEEMKFNLDLWNKYRVNLIKILENQFPKLADGVNIQDTIFSILQSPDTAEWDNDKFDLQENFALFGVKKSPILEYKGTTRDQSIPELYKSMLTKCAKPQAYLAFSKAKIDHYKGLKSYPWMETKQTLANFVANTKGKPQGSVHFVVEEKQGQTSINTPWGTSLGPITHSSSFINQVEEPKEGQSLADALNMAIESNNEMPEVMSEGLFRRRRRSAAPQPVVKPILVKSQRFKMIFKAKGLAGISVRPGNWLDTNVVNSVRGQTCSANTMNGIGYLPQIAWVAYQPYIKLEISASAWETYKKIWDAKNTIGLTVGNMLFRHANFKKAVLADKSFPRHARMLYEDDAALEYQGDEVIFKIEEREVSQADEEEALITSQSENLEMPEVMSEGLFRRRRRSAPPPPPPPPKKIYEKVYTVELISNLPKPETIAVTSRKF